MFIIVMPRGYPLFAKVVEDTSYQFSFLIAHVMSYVSGQKQNGFDKLFVLIGGTIHLPEDFFFQSWNALV